MLIANYADDEFLLKMIAIVKYLSKAKIRALYSPWRERFNAISLAEKDLLYSDDRLKFPKLLRTPIKNSSHWGHPGKGQMLRQINDIR